MLICYQAHSVSNGRDILYKRWENYVVLELRFLSTNVYREPIMYQGIVLGARD